MTPIRPRRSALYMPGSNARAIEKAKTLPTDVVIFDLEDAVAPDVKEQAREQVCAAVKAGGYGRRELVIRINSLETSWGEADLAAAAAAAPDAILVPKVSSAETLAAVRDGAGTAFEAARRLGWTRRHRRYDDLDLFNKTLAAGETAAHLDVLVVRGELQSSTVDGVVEYSLTRQGS